MLCQALTRKGKSCPYKAKKGIACNIRAHITQCQSRVEQKLPISIEEKKDQVNNLEELCQHFLSNLKGIKLEKKSKHDGELGHQVEKIFGVKPNSSMKSDLSWLELKTCGKRGDKTTLWDKNPSWIYGKEDKLSNKDFNTKFCHWFGTPKKEKGGRWSWSGTVSPQYYENWSWAGQKITLDKEENVIIIYCYEKDARPFKDEVIPEELKNKATCIARWDKRDLENHLAQKYSASVALITHKEEKIEECRINSRPLLYSDFLNNFRSKLIFFDSGRKEGEARNYSSFRGKKEFWLAFCSKKLLQ